MILGMASYSSELSLAFGAAMLATGLATVMNERMQAIHRDFAMIQKRTAQIELEYSLLFGGEEDEEDDSDLDSNMLTLASSPWVGPI
jgi:hypothetical protein